MIEKLQDIILTAWHRLFGAKNAPEATLSDVVELLEDIKAQLDVLVDQQYRPEGVENSGTNDKQ